MPDAIRHLEKDPAGAYFDAVSQVVMPRWSTGRAVLLGDAAWCVTLFAGHGVALALAGAHQLGAALQQLAEWKQDVARKPPNGRHSPAAECSGTHHPASSTYG